jgi:hypothetical protein
MTSEMLVIDLVEKQPLAQLWRGVSLMKPPLINPSLTMHKWPQASKMLSLVNENIKTSKTRTKLGTMPTTRSTATPACRLCPFLFFFFPRMHHANDKSLMEGT